MGHALSAPIGRSPPSQIAECESGIFKVGSLLVGFLRNLRRLVIADVRIQRGNKHERILHVIGDALVVRFNPYGTMLIERIASVSK
jgi:hypothetical protein